MKVLIEKHICCTFIGCKRTFEAVLGSLAMFETLKTSF